MKNICVRAPAWLGDAVVSTVFLFRLKNRFPDSRITVVSTETLAPLFRAHPAVNDVLPLVKSPDVGWGALQRSLQSAKFTDAYILPRSFRSALESWLAAIPRRVGFGGDLRRVFFTETIPYDPTLRYAHRYLKMIDEESLDLASHAPFFPSDDSATDLFEREKRKVSRPILAMAPVSIAPSRTWEADRFADVGRRFVAATGGSVAVLGSSNEAAATARVAAAIGEPALDLGGKLGLVGLGSVLRLADLFVGNDSGLMHVAAACGKSGVIIFGASEPKTALPPSGQLEPIQDRTLRCVPCLRNHCVRFGEFHNGCLRGVTAEVVANRLLEMVRSRRASA